MEALALSLIPAFTIIWSGLVGFLIARYLLLRAKSKKYTSRLIDLISFSLTGVGIVVSLLAISAYERRLHDHGERIKIASGSLKAIEEISDIVLRRCPNFEDLFKLLHAEQATAKDCMALYEYVRGLVNVNFLRAVQLPAAPLRHRFADDNALRALDEIAAIVDDQRKTARAFIFSEAEGIFDERDLLQLLAIYVAAVIFAAAFGMGLVRRINDLRTARIKSTRRT